MIGCRFSTSSISWVLMQKIRLFWLLEQQFLGWSVSVCSINPYQVSFLVSCLLSFSSLHLSSALLLLLSLSFLFSRWIYQLLVLFLMILALHHWCLDVFLDLPRMVICLYSSVVYCIVGSTVNIWVRRRENSCEVSYLMFSQLLSML